MSETLLRLGRRSMCVIQLSVYVSRGISHFRLVNFDLLASIATTFEYVVIESTMLGAINNRKM